MKSKIFITTIINKVKVTITTAFTVIIAIGLLFVAIKTIDAIQTANPTPCERQTDPGCLDDGQKPEPGLICPNPRTACPRNEG